MDHIVNTDQAEFWSGDPGQAWVSKQPFFDALLSPALDLLYEIAELRTGEQIVDIGCGTGTSLLESAKQVGETGHVTGVDVSTPMLAMALERVKAAGLSNVDCIEADAQIYDMSEFQADHVISRFGVMFFDAPHAAFANIATALKPRGRLSFICWATLRSNPWFQLPAAIAKDVVGAPPPPDPRAPGPMAFAEQSYIQDILNASGFRDIEMQEVSVELTPLGSCEEVATFAATEGPAMRIVREMGGTEEHTSTIRTRLIDSFEQFSTPEGMRVPALFNVVKARV
ncbi:MAG: class I SAM-dependent methyltransferase [Pseudomonadota bacterium]